MAVQQFMSRFELQFLTFISIVNRGKLLAFPGCHYGNWRKTNGNDHEWRIEARICSNGPRQAARNREQGRQGEPRRRPQEQLEPLDSFLRAE
jgi:hypothetical protein